MPTMVSVINTNNVLSLCSRHTMLRIIHEHFLESNIPLIINIAAHLNESSAGYSVGSQIAQPPTDRYAELLMYWNGN